MAILNLTDGRLNWFLIVFEGVTAVFCGLFITAYLLGLRDLPDNVVYHSDPTFRIPLSIFGVLSILLILTIIILTFLVKRKK